MNDVTKKHCFARFLPQSLFAFLLAAFVFAAGITANNITSAATATHKVTDTTGTVTRVELTNLDLDIYSQYNADVEAVNKDLMSATKFNQKYGVDTKPKRILAKAVPGQTIKIRIVPESGYDKGSFSFNGSLMGRFPFKIANNSFSGVKDDDMDFYALNGGLKYADGRYTLIVEEKPWPLPFPQNADMLYVCWMNSYRGQTIKHSIRTEYYIFTSDEAFKKAYKLWTGKTISGPIGSSSSDSKKDPAKTNADKKTEAQSPKGDDGGTDWGTIGMVGGGLAATGAIGFGAVKLFGGGGKAGAGATSSVASPQEPESFVYTDPATGAQTLYERDPNTGEWFNPSTGGIVDMNDLDRFNRQRMADNAWIHDQTSNMIEHKTDIDRAWQQQAQEAAREMQKKFEEIDRQGAKDRVAINSGTYGMSDAQRIDRQKSWQAMLEADQKASHRLLNLYDGATKTLEMTEKAADISIDIAATAAKAVDGGVVSGRIKDAYSMAKNVAGSASDAVANGKSIWKGIGKGVANGLVDIAQNNANGVYKTLSYVGGEGFKGGLDAAWKGEDMTIGAFKGALKGTMKLGIDKVGEKISNGITKPEDSLRNAFNHAREIRTVYSKGISQKSVDALQKMNLDKHLANVEKAGYQSWAANITNALSSNLLPDAVLGS